MDFYHKIRINSGGQTGADRAALDFALQHQIDCGGWCPKGRKAEDGIIDPQYPLRETNNSNYPERTKTNIENSDGTVIFYLTKFDAGTGLTLNLCKKLDKPFHIVKLSEIQDPSLFRKWVTDNSIKTINVAGPRESSDPGIYKAVMNFLEKSFNP